MGTYIITILRVGFICTNVHVLITHVHVHIFLNEDVKCKRMQMLLIYAHNIEMRYAGLTFSLSDWLSPMNLLSDGSSKRLLSESPSSEDDDVSQLWSPTFMLSSTILLDTESSICPITLNQHNKPYATMRASRDGEKDWKPYVRAGYLRSEGGRRRIPTFASGSLRCGEVTDTKPMATPTTG